MLYKRLRHAKYLQSNCNPYNHNYHVTKSPTERRIPNMKVERIFNNEAPITLENLLESILREKIDSLVSNSYDNSMVNSTTSHTKGEDVA